MKTLQKSAERCMPLIGLSWVLIVWSETEIKK